MGNAVGIPDFLSLITVNIGGGDGVVAPVRDGEAQHGLAGFILIKEEIFLAHKAAVFGRGAVIAVEITFLAELVVILDMLPGAALVADNLLVVVRNIATVNGDDRGALVVLRDVGVIALAVNRERAGNGRRRRRAVSGQSRNACGGCGSADCAARQPFKGGVVPLFGGGLVAVGERRKRSPAALGVMVLHEFRDAPDVGLKRLAARAFGADVARLICGRQSQIQQSRSIESAMRGSRAAAGAVMIFVSMFIGYLLLICRVCR